VSRARQRNVAGWVARKRAGTKTAAAAEAAQSRLEPAEAPPERPEGPPNGTPGEGAE
jgi:bifunctional UDP-N-acetylglucosamine pyrophosphorylase/glucosamine-1-phosphate N-acetyltransferase